MRRQARVQVPLVSGEKGREVHLVHAVPGHGRWAAGRDRSQVYAGFPRRRNCRALAIHGSAINDGAVSAATGVGFAFIAVSELGTVSALSTGTAGASVGVVVVAA